MIHSLISLDLNSIIKIFNQMPFSLQSPQTIPLNLTFNFKWSNSVSHTAHGIIITYI